MTPAVAPQELDIIEHPVVARWLVETAKHDPEGFVCLTRGNQDAFLRQWGPPAARFKPTADAPWTAAWAVTENGLAWWVMTSPTSACYRLRFSGSKEGQLNDPRVSTGAVAFLKQQLALLNP